MSEQAPNTAISALMVIIVIFVVAIVFFTLFTDTGSQITDIFDEVFYSNKEESAKVTTVETQAALIDTLNKCFSDPTINPHTAEKCFCSIGTVGSLGVIGVISDNSYISVQNNNGLTITAFDSDDTPLEQKKESYSLGLFAVKDSGTEKELGCIFPSQYFIQGEDIDTIGFNSEESFFGIGEHIVNHWNIVWKDARAEKYAGEVGEDYIFGFYRDKEENSGYKYDYNLRNAPILYKVSDTQYCLLTDLIEHELSDASGLSYEGIYNLESTEEELGASLLSIKSDSGEDRSKDTLPDFFTSYATYCNKL